MAPGLYAGIRAWSGGDSGEWPRERTGLGRAGTGSLAGGGSSRGCRQRARQGLIGTLRGLRAQEAADGFLKAPLQHAAEAVVWHPACTPKFGPGREVIAVNGREKEQSSDAPVQVRLLAAVALELGTGAQELGGRLPRAPTFN